MSAPAGNRTRASECVEACWTPVPCPECGADLPPRGRSVPLAMSLPYCCEDHRYDAANKRHLWDAKDDERWRFGVGS